MTDVNGRSSWREERKACVCLVAASLLFLVAGAAPGAAAQVADLTCDEARIQEDVEKLKKRTEELGAAQDLVEMQRCVAKTTFLLSYAQYRSVLVPAFSKERAQTCNGLREQIKYLTESGESGTEALVAQLEKSVVAWERATTPPPFAGVFEVLGSNPADSHFAERLFTLDGCLQFLETAATLPGSSAAARDQARGVLDRLGEVKTRMQAGDPTGAQEIINELRQWVVDAPVEGAVTAAIDAIRAPVTLTLECCLLMEQPRHKSDGDKIMSLRGQPVLGPSGQVAFCVELGEVRRGSVTNGVTEIQCGRWRSMRRLLGGGDRLPFTADTLGAPGPVGLWVDAEGRLVVQPARSLYRESTRGLELVAGNNLLYSPAWKPQEYGAIGSLAIADNGAVLYVISPGPLPMLPPEVGKEGKTNKEKQKLMQQWIAENQSTAPRMICLCSGGQTHVIAREGDHALGFPETLRFGPVFEKTSISEDGSFVAFTDTPDGPGARGENGLWRWGADGLQVVAVAGSSTVDGAKIVAIQDLLDLNSCGDIAFTALIDRGRPGAVELEIFVGSPGSLRVVKPPPEWPAPAIGSPGFVELCDDGRMLLATPARGVAKATEQPGGCLYGPVDSLTWYPEVSALAVSPDGLVVSTRSITMVPTVWAGPPDDLELVVRGGDSVEIGPGDVRKVYFNATDPELAMNAANTSRLAFRINDRGDVLLLLNLDGAVGKVDPASGVFLARVPVHAGK